MNEERRQILEMLASGKITAEEAERLLDAVVVNTAEPVAAKRTPKYLRVVVNSEETIADGPSRINVRVPLQLLRAGVRLTALLPPQALLKANSELEKSGWPIDLTQLKPQDLEELIDHLYDVTVDVDDPSAKVQVFCE